jgi:hypothetical protein
MDPDMDPVMDPFMDIECDPMPPPRPNAAGLESTTPMARQTTESFFMRKLLCREETDRLREKCSMAGVSCEAAHSRDPSGPPG